MQQKISQLQQSDLLIQQLQSYGTYSLGPYPQTQAAVIPFVIKAQTLIKSTSCRVLFHYFFNAFKLIPYVKKHVSLGHQKFIKVDEIPEQISYNFKKARYFGIGYRQETNSHQQWKKKLLSYSIQYKQEPQEQEQNQQGDINKDTNKDHYLIFAKQSDGRYYIFHSFENHFDFDTWYKVMIQNHDEIYKDQFVQTYNPFEKPKQFAMAYLHKAGVKSDVFVRNYMSAEMIKEYFWIQ